MSRGTKAFINQSALQHNFSVVKKNAPQSKVWSVVKANAYGHSVEFAVKALNALTDGFAVATLAEGLRLRTMGVEKPILLLEGITVEAHLQQVVEQNFQIVVHCKEQIDFFRSLTATQSVSVWLKVDSGLHRIGFSPTELSDVLGLLHQHSQVSLIGFMTHLANADSSGHPSNALQLHTFDESVGAEATASVANSAAIVHFPESHRDWVRPGIMLYGSTPSAERSAKELGLKPVMTLKTPIIALRDVKKGERVGYGHRWQAGSDSRIATLAIGYGDGYPRHAPDGTPLWLHGQKVLLAGRVSMDMITVDVTGVTEVKVGDMVECWGTHLSVDEVAATVGTIGYELLTRISNRVEYELVSESVSHP